MSYAYIVELEDYQYKLTNLIKPKVKRMDSIPLLALIVLAFALFPTFLISCTKDNSIPVYPIGKARIEIDFIGDYRNYKINLSISRLSTLNDTRVIPEITIPNGLNWTISTKDHHLLEDITSSKLVIEGIEEPGVEGAGMALFTIKSTQIRNIGEPNHIPLSGRAEVSFGGKLAARKYWSSEPVRIAPGKPYYTTKNLIVNVVVGRDNSWIGEADSWIGKDESEFD